MSQSPFVSPPDLSGTIRLITIEHCWQAGTSPCGDTTQNKNKHCYWSSLADWNTGQPVLDWVPLFQVAYNSETNTWKTPLCTRESADEVQYMKKVVVYRVCSADSAGKERENMQFACETGLHCCSASVCRYADRKIQWMPFQDERVAGAWFYLWCSLQSFCSFGYVEVSRVTDLTLPTTGHVAYTIMQDAFFGYSREWNWDGYSVGGAHSGSQHMLLALKRIHGKRS